MKTLWLTRDEAWVVFDTKEMKDMMECPLSDYEVEVQLSDADYASYMAAREAWYEWQNKLSAMLDKGSLG